MNRHIQIESLPSLAGSNADLRIPVMPSEEDQAIVQLYNAIASAKGKAVLNTSYAKDEIAEVAKELLAAEGKSVVLSGSNNQDTQLLVIAINEMLGNYGSTISNNITYSLKEGSDKAVSEMIARMEAGSVAGLIVDASNPVYTLGASFERRWLTFHLLFQCLVDSTKHLESVPMLLPTTIGWNLGETLCQPQTILLLSSHVSHPYLIRALRKCFTLEW